MEGVASEGGVRAPEAKRQCQETNLLSPPLSQIEPMTENQDPDTIYGMLVVLG